MSNLLNGGKSYGHFASEAPIVTIGKNGIKIYSMPQYIPPTVLESIPKNRLSYERQGFSQNSNLFDT